MHSLEQNGVMSKKSQWERTIVLWGASSYERKEEMSNVLVLVSAGTSICQSGDINTVTISWFLEQS